MRTIWKFPLEPKDVCSIEMPAGALPLGVGWDLGECCVFAFVDSESPRVKRRFRLASTGSSIGDGPWKLLEGEDQILAHRSYYVGTIPLSPGCGALHVFDYGEVDGEVTPDAVPAEGGG